MLPDDCTSRPTVRIFRTKREARSSIARVAGAAVAAPFFLLAMGDVAFGYVGPGAGFALVTSALVVFGAIALAAIYLIAWPIRLAWRTLLGRRAFKDARAKRVIVLGLDGLDPGQCKEYMAQGKLKNLSELNYLPLGTTLPALSPVAWSTFQTGLDPSGHGLFDFLRPARPHYSAEISSVTTSMPPKSISFGRYKIPLGKPRIRLRRRGVPFWKILGKQGIFSAIVRVPISFPPEKFRGVALSAMCVPDLRGSQGTFTEFAQAPDGEYGGDEASEGGVRVTVKVDGDRVQAVLVGPPNPVTKKHEELTAPFSVTIDRANGKAEVRLADQRAELVPGLHTDWMEVTFKAGLTVKVKGIVRFCLISLDPFRLYASPIHFHPEKPAQPISHPASYVVYLGKSQGRFATLGLAEDTWALNERVLDEDMFLDGTYRIHAEREKMFFDALDKVRKGLVVCVFDASDRIQHMFYRTRHDDHPANRGKETERHKSVLPEMYERMDELVGRARAQLREGDVLLVMSDHGFANFSRGINLNAWLRQEGYLKMKDGHEGGAWYAGVDWEQTQAYALGLSGIFINMKGREQDGIVDATWAKKLKVEICEKLEKLRDPQFPDKVTVHKAYDSATVGEGPYRDEAPDILIGYGIDYRISWNGATGHAEGEIFEDNTKSWSGDHCVDPSFVPGVLFSTRPFTEDAAHIKDLAPTTLDLLGAPIPKSMRGRRLFGGEVGGNVDGNGATS